MEATTVEGGPFVKILCLAMKSNHEMIAKVWPLWIIKRNEIYSALTGWTCRVISRGPTFCRPSSYRCQPMSGKLVERYSPACKLFQFEYPPVAPVVDRITSSAAAAAVYFPPLGLRVSEATWRINSSVCVAFCRGAFFWYFQRGCMTSGLGDRLVCVLGLTLPSLPLNPPSLGPSSC